MFLSPFGSFTTLPIWVQYGFRLRLGHFKKNVKFIFSAIIIIIVNFFQLHRIERPKVHTFIEKKSIFEKLTSKLKVKVCNLKEPLNIAIVPLISTVN